MRCSIINEMNTLKRHTRKTELFPAQGISRKTRNVTGLGVLDEFHRAASFIRNFSARRAATSEIALAFANTLKSPHAVCAEPRDSGEFPFSDTTPRRQGKNKKKSEAATTFRLPPSRRGASTPQARHTMLALFPRYDLADVTAPMSNQSRGSPSPVLLRMKRTFSLPQRNSDQPSGFPRKNPIPSFPSLRPNDVLGTNA